MFILIDCRLVEALKVFTSLMRTALRCRSACACVLLAALLILQPAQTAFGQIIDPNAVEGQCYGGCESFDAPETSIWDEDGDGSIWDDTSGSYDDDGARVNQAKVSAFKAYWRNSQKYRLKPWIEMDTRLDRPYQLDKSEIPHPAHDLGRVLDWIVNQTEFDFPGYKTKEMARAVEQFAKAFIDLRLKEDEQSVSIFNQFPSLHRMTAAELGRMSASP